LWDIGVLVRDATTFNGETNFNMLAIFMWTMHDLPVYGIVASTKVTSTTKKYILLVA
jgi:hypothetical protein